MCLTPNYDELTMAGGDVVPILGGFIIVSLTILLFTVFVLRPIFNRTIRRALGVAKIQAITHGTKSWEQIEVEFTEDYKAGITSDAVLDLIADAYEGFTVEELDAKNPHAGAYSPTSEFQNAESLGRYLDWRTDPKVLVAEREEFLDKQSTALALSIVLNHIRSGALRREETKDVQ